MRGNRLASTHGVHALVGLAFDADRVDVDAKHAAPDAARISSMNGASFGRSRITVTSAPETVQPSPRTISTARASKASPAAPFHCGIGIGE